MKRDSKKITSVYISEELLERAKREGINLSQLLNAVLQELLEDSRELELSKLEEEIRELRQRLEILEIKRQELLKKKAEREKKRYKEAKLKELMLKHQELKRKGGEAKTQQEIDRLEKESKKVFNEILNLAGLQKGTPEFFEFSKRLNAGKIEEAISMVKGLWKK